jgi:hypothetical protein
MLLTSLISRLNKGGAIWGLDHEDFGLFMCIPPVFRLIVVQVCRINEFDFTKLSLGIPNFPFTADIIDPEVLGFW